MAEKVKPMLQLRKLLQDEKLREKLLSAKNERELAQLLNRAGERQGVKFTEPWLSDVLVDAKTTRWPPVFTESELLLLASGGFGNVADTAPKLCHTDSCGGGHSGCC